MFTAGPWNIGISGRSGQCTFDGYHPEREFPHDIGGLSIYAEGNQSICHVVWDAYNRIEREANARLIAHAPDYHEHAYNLAMLIHQSKLYQSNPKVKLEVDNVLAIHAKVIGCGKLNKRKGRGMK